MPDTAPSIPLPPSSGTICVVGAGFMGCVITTLYAHHGHDVALCDMNTELLASFAERARPIAATFADDSAAVDAMLARVRTEPSLAEAVKLPVGKYRNTKVVCTMGPACWDVETLGKMMDIGMNVCRLNFRWLSVRVPARPRVRTAANVTSS